MLKVGTFCFYERFFNRITVYVTFEELFMFEFKQYEIGKPQNLVVFLHGYNGDLNDHQYAVDWLKKYLQNSILLTPQAPEICDKNPSKKQWFGMLKHDTNNLRTLPTTDVADIFAVYEKAAPKIEEQAIIINQFVQEQQKKYNIDNAHTFFIGFSQGAMLAIYAALIGTKKIGAVFALSGLVAGKDRLAIQIKSHPFIYLFHGEQDLKVQYKTLAESDAWLNAHGIKNQIKTYQDLTHHINEDEIITIAQIIRKLTQ